MNRQVDHKPRIAQSAAEIVRLHRRIHETGGQRDTSNEARQIWSDACAEFRNKYDELAFPGGVDSAIRRMRAGDPTAIGYALDFIELRPYFFRSGYMYNHFLRVLRNCELSSHQRERYNKVYERYLEYRRKRNQNDR